MADHPNTTLCQASTDDPGHKSELVIGVTIQVTNKGLLHNRNQQTFIHNNYQVTKLLRPLHNGEDPAYILTTEVLDEESTSALIAQETLLGHYGSKRLVAQY